MGVTSGGAIHARKKQHSVFASNKGRMLCYRKVSDIAAVWFPTLSCPDLSTLLKKFHLFLICVNTVDKNYFLRHSSLLIPLWLLCGFIADIAKYGHSDLRG